MSEIIKKRFGSDILREKKEAPKPKGEELPEEDEEDEELPGKTKESREDQEKLTKEAWEKYAEELKEITKIAKEAGFKAVSITAPGEGGTRFKNSDTLFFTRNSLDNFREALKFIKKEDLYQGMKIEFSELKKRFEEPAIKIYRELDIEKNRLEKLEKKVETNEKKLLGKANDLVIGQKNIEKLRKELDENQREKLSESEIKEQALRFVIMNILYAGIENSTAFKITRLEELWDKKKISLADRQKEFLEIVSSSLRPIREIFPKLDEENIQDLEKEWLKTTKEIGEKYLEHKEKQEKYDFGIYR